MNRYVLTLDFEAERDRDAARVTEAVMEVLGKKASITFTAERVLCQCLDGAMYRNIVSIEAPK